jgi:hypothetical protein
MSGAIWRHRMHEISLEKNRFFSSLEIRHQKSGSFGAGQVQ